MNLNELIKHQAQLLRNYSGNPDAAQIARGILAALLRLHQIQESDAELREPHEWFFIVGDKRVYARSPEALADILAATEPGR